MHDFKQRNIGICARTVRSNQDKCPLDLNEPLWVSANSIRLKALLAADFG